METEGIPAVEPGTTITAHELVRTTMGELGNNLPHGVLQPGGALTSFGFLPPTMGQKKRLGAVKARKDLRKYPGKLVAYWLAEALAELCGKDMTKGSLDERALQVAKLPVGDVLYLLFAYQRIEKPDGFPLTATGCGVCGASFDSILVDLDSMVAFRLPRDGDEYPEGHDQAGEAMTVATAAEPPTCRVGLVEGFEYPKGKTVHTVLLRPATWLATWWPLGDGQVHNDELLRAKTIRAMIAGVDTCAAKVVTEAAIDELLPRDVHLIDEGAGLITPTLHLGIEVTCPDCLATNQAVLDWGDPAFFGSSARG